MCDAVIKGVGAVVIAEEALTSDPDTFIRCLEHQPVWSDLPVIALSRSGSESSQLARLLEHIGNITVVERPVRISTFLSVVRAALRSRDRQYQVRGHLRRMEIVEAERTVLLESERSARSEAERSVRMKDEFLATLSHEIRTPLNAIMGWTHILRMGPQSEEDLAKGLEIIDRNAQAQSQIVSDLLDMNRIVNGKVRLDLRPVQLAPIVQAAIDTVTPAAESRAVRLHSILDPSATPVSGDPERLQQVFWNLLSNAVKFTPKGGKVQVTLERVHSHWQVSVIDTGEGIDPDFLPHVFDRFRQADGSTTRRHGGLGLGLAIVKQLVELHGGTVSATSPGPRMGSTFTVSLPISSLKPTSPAEPAHRRSNGAASAIAATGHEDIEGVRVLVVDDEPDSRDVVRRLLESRKACVKAAANAHEAIALLEEWRPDVLISDIGMPEEDGYSLVKRVRALAPESGGHTAAIALTAYARAEDRAHALKAGFQYHLSKPVQATELVALVARAAKKASHV
jgi:signal transduction histidine kinase/CheY-like chemotaxis protein